MGIERVNMDISSIRVQMGERTVVSFGAPLLSSIEFTWRRAVSCVASFNYHPGLQAHKVLNGSERLRIQHPTKNVIMLSLGQAFSLVNSYHKQTNNTCVGLRLFCPRAEDLFLRITLGTFLTKHYIFLNWLKISGSRFWGRFLTRKRARTK